MVKPITVGSVFSGVGGFDLGFEQAGGYELVFQVEKDPACGNVLGRRWPAVSRYGDVKEVTGERLRSDLGPRANVDVLVGGFPCTDLSVAGRRAGLAGDESGLFFEFIRLATEIRPAWLLIENVPGLLSSHGGRDMGTVVGHLAELGYGWAYRCLDASHFGVPQRRRRIFIVGHLGSPWSAPASVLLEPESVYRHLAAGVEAEEDVADAAGEGVVGDGELVGALTSVWGGPDDNSAQAGHLIAEHHDEQIIAADDGAVIAPTVAHTLLGVHERGSCRHTDIGGMTYVSQVVGDGWQDKLARTLTAPEHGPRFDFDTESLVVEGESLPSQESFAVFPESGQGSDLVARPTDQAGAITAEGYSRTTDRGVFVVTPNTEDVERIAAFGVSENQRAELRLTDISRQMTTGGGKAGQGYPAVLEGYAPKTAATLTSGSAASPGVNPPGRRKEDDENLVVYPLAVRGRDGGSQIEMGEEGVYNTLRAGDGGSSRSLALVGSAASWAVRRLTPLECERLQGFPDHYTEGQADTVRYRQMGNAVAVPVIRWIAGRLRAVHEGRDPNV